MKIPVFLRNLLEKFGHLNRVAVFEQSKKTMRPYFFPLFLAIIIISCSSNDDEIDCSLLDIAPQLFFIEYTDEEGNNLLEDGTYVHEEIEVTVNGVVMGEVYTLNAKTFLIIYEYGQLQNNESEYLIKLSPTETDIMQLDYSQKAGLCGTHIYTVERAVYNDEEMELENYSGNEKITVVKSR